MSRHGIYTTVDGRPGVRFERRLRHGIAAVWRTVTEPAELAHWFPCAVEVDLRVGGAMRFTFSPDFVLDGEVLELDPPRLFAFRWGKDLLRFALTAEDGDTRLVLEHALVEEGRDAAAKTAAGWHVCLDALEETVAGRGGDTPGGPSPEWRAHYDAYVAAGMPAGAKVPTGA
jgi:uncharacterized protein YndB with AHSA1/START domain